MILLAKEKEKTELNWIELFTVIMQEYNNI